MAEGAGGWGGAGLREQPQAPALKAKANNAAAELRIITCLLVHPSDQPASHRRSVAGDGLPGRREGMTRWVALRARAGSRQGRCPLVRAHGWPGTSLSSLVSRVRSPLHLFASAGRAIRQTRTEPGRRVTRVRLRRLLRICGPSEAASSCRVAAEATGQNRLSACSCPSRRAVWPPIEFADEVPASGNN